MGRASGWDLLMSRRIRPPRAPGTQRGVERGRGEGFQRVRGGKRWGKGEVAPNAAVGMSSATDIVGGFDLETVERSRSSLNRQTICVAV